MVMAGSPAARSKATAAAFRPAAVALALAAVSAHSPLWAQAGAQVLPPTREEVTRPDSPRLGPRSSRLAVEGGIEREPCALDSPEFENVRFTLRGVRFDGLEGLGEADLAPAHAGMIGLEQPISAVCEIRDRAAAILSDSGYIAAVEVPEQRIAEGIVRFRVVMARMTQVRVRGNATGAERVIGGYLTALSKRPVFNRNDAERYLLLASDLPGYDVRLTLRPAGTVAGEVIGDVTVQRTAAFAEGNLQNGGSEALGPWGGLVRGQLFGLTGLADRTTLGAFATLDGKEQQTLQLGHDFRLGSEGLAASAMVTHAWASPSIGSDSPVRARTLLASADLSYPFIRSLTLNLRGSVGMDFVNQDVRLGGLDLARDRLRVAFARLVYDWLADERSSGRSFAEPEWRLWSLIEARKGLSVLGDGGSPPSRIEGRASAAVLRSNLLAEFRPVPRFTLALGLRGQYARKPLLSFEEFSAGNYTVGRGYDPGALTGDRGFGLHTEVRAGSLIPKGPGRVALEGYGFFDHARIANRDRSPAAVEAGRLSSAGAGARLAYDRFVLDVVFAAPLSRIGPLDEKPDPRLLISLTSRMWPWSLQ